MTSTSFDVGFDLSLGMFIGGWRFNTQKSQ
jgi:hypothetical protein